MVADTGLLDPVRMSFLLGGGFGAAIGNSSGGFTFQIRRLGSEMHILLSSRRLHDAPIRAADATRRLP